MKKLQRPRRTPSKQEDTVENNDKGSFEEGYQSTTHTQTHTHRDSRAGSLVRWRGACEEAEKKGVEASSQMPTSTPVLSRWHIQSWV